MQDIKNSLKPQPIAQQTDPPGFSSNFRPIQEAGFPDIPPPRLPPPQIQPFLGLHAKLSQAFASYTMVFLLISAFQLFRTRDSVERFTLATKQSMATDCYALEKTVTSLVSLPHFAAQSVNHGLVTALDSAISQIGYGLEVVLTGVLATLDFLVTMLTGTWRCFLLNLANSGIPLLDELGEGGVEALDAMEKALVGLMALPLNDLGMLIQQRMANPQIGLVVNVSVMPILDVEFCDDALGLVAVDRLTEDFQRWILYGTLAIVGMAVVAVAGNMLWIAFWHKRWKVHVERVMQQLGVLSKVSDVDKRTCGVNSQPCALEDKWVANQKMYALRVSHMTRHPLLYRFVSWSSRRLFPKDENLQSLYFWFVYYVTHPQATGCLFIGALGLGLIYSQIALIEYFRTHYRPILTTFLIDLSDTVLQLVNEIMSTTSATFAVETNTALANVEADLNANVFGAIVQAAADMNTALAQVQTTLVQGIQAVFGDGAFGKLVVMVLQCLLLNKLAAVETGLSWIRDHARITLPRLSDDVLLLNPTEINKLVLEAVNGLAGGEPWTSPSSSSINASTATGYLEGEFRVVDGAIGVVFKQYEGELRRELPVYYGLVCVWFVVLAMGAVGASVIFVRHRNVPS